MNSVAIRRIYKEYLQCKELHPDRHMEKCKGLRQAWIDAVHEKEGHNLMCLLETVL